ncbi:MAG: hypothetical protein ACOC1K_02865 [Nanoarchaeota archaeon]
MNPLLEKLFYSFRYFSKPEEHYVRFVFTLKELIGELCYFKKYGILHGRKGFAEGLEIIIEKLMTMRREIDSLFHGQRPQKPVGSLSKYYVEGKPGDDPMIETLELVEQIYQDWIDGKIEL